MAMQPQLFSLSGLAVEFGRDRRTVANLMAGVPSDGMRSGHPAWHLRSALPYLGKGARSSDGSGGSSIGEHFVERLEDWKEIAERQERPSRIDIDTAAQNFGVESQIILIWLRSGAPFLEQGDYQTGRGFVLYMPHLFDWRLLVGSALRAANDTDAMRRLGMDR